MWDRDRSLNDARDPFEIRIGVKQSKTHFENLTIGSACSICLVVALMVDEKIVNKYHSEITWLSVYHEERQETFLEEEEEADE